MGVIKKFLGFVDDKLGITDFLTGMIKTVGSWIGLMVSKGIRTVFFLINESLYKVVIYLYDSFEALCSSRLLDSEIVGTIGSRIGAIAGTIMLFYVLIGFIKLLIDPDLIPDKSRGAAAIIKKVVIVILMLGMYQGVFEMLYSIQRSAVQSHAISNLLLPSSPSTANGSFGSLIAEETFSTFYHVQGNLDMSAAEADDQAKYAECQSALTQFRSEIVNDGEFRSGRRCLNETVKVAEEDPDRDAEAQNEFIVRYDWPLATIVAIALIYFLFSYCVQVGVRMGQMMLLEIWAPVAIISYLSSSQEMFKKWIRLYIGTYLDVFIRIAVINFAVFLIANLLSTNSFGGFVFWQDVIAQSDETKGFFAIIMTLALLAFAKRAPDIIKQLMPSGTGSGLSFGGLHMKDIPGLNKAAGFATGAIGGAAAGVAGGVAAGKGFFGKAGSAITGGVGGTLRGAFSGGATGGVRKGAAAGFNAQNNSAYRTRQRVSNGGSHFVLPGAQRRLDAIEAEYAEAEDFLKTFNAAKSKADSEVSKFESNYSVAGFDVRGKTDWTLSELNSARTNSYYTAEEQAKLNDVYQQLHGIARDEAMNANGAVKAGTITWNYDVTTKSVGSIDKEKTNVSARAINVEIKENMDKILDSDVAKKSEASTRFDKAKEASTSYEEKVIHKINDKAYARAKADAKYSGKQK